MIITIRDGNKQFVISAALLFGLRKKETMKTTQREYLQALDPNAPASFLTVGDVLAIYELLDEARKTTAEQERQAAEASEIDDWLDSLTENELSFISWVSSTDGCGTDSDLPAFAMGR
jgi:hypothetical protein